VKSKVSITKDDKFLQERKKMVERFLTIVFSELGFDIQKYKPISRFLSDK
jgi:hypothetical protein